MLRRENWFAIFHLYIMEKRVVFVKSFSQIIQIIVIILTVSTYNYDDVHVPCWQKYVKDVVNEISIFLGEMSFDQCILYMYM